MRLVAWGTIAILVGSVLPWAADGGGPVWAWDLALVWVLTGEASSMGVPLSIGALVVVAGLVLTRPLLRRTLPSTVAGLASAVSVVGLSVLVGVRLLGLQPPMWPRIGLLVCFAGGLVAAGGSASVFRRSRV